MKRRKIVTDNDRDDHTPAIIFIDEINTIATKRFDAQTGADWEVQQILLKLLNQMDSFEQGSNVKVHIHKMVDSDTNILSGYHGYESG